MTPEQIRFELEYWTAPTTSFDGRRYLALLDYWQIPPATSVLEIGTGPFGGLIQYLEAPIRIGLEPLLAQYQAHRILREPPGVRLEAHSLETWWAGGGGVFEAVVTMDALDHGDGDIVRRLRLIDRLLQPGGYVGLHVHCRTPEQINEAHPRPWSADTLLNFMAELGWTWVRMQVTPRDPWTDASYTTLCGLFRSTPNA